MADTLHIVFNPLRIHRGNLFALIRRLPAFKRIGFYAFVFAVFDSHSAAANAASLLAAVPGISTVEYAKNTYHVPYPQPPDTDSPSTNVIHLTHLPPNYTRDELFVLCSDFDGFQSIQFYGKYCYARFVTHQCAYLAWSSLRQETNLVVTFAKPKPLQATPISLQPYFLQENHLGVSISKNDVPENDYYLEPMDHSPSSNGLDWEDDTDMDLNTLTDHVPSGDHSRFETDYGYEALPKNYSRPDVHAVPLWNPFLHQRPGKDTRLPNPVDIHQIQNSATKMPDKTFPGERSKPARLVPSSSAEGDSFLQSIVQVLIEDDPLVPDFRSADFKAFAKSTSQNFSDGNQRQWILRNSEDVPETKSDSASLVEALENLAKADFSFVNKPPRVIKNSEDHFSGDQQVSHQNEKNSHDETAQDRDSFDGNSDDGSFNQGENNKNRGYRCSENVRLAIRNAQLSMVTARVVSHRLGLTHGSARTVETPVRSGVGSRESLFVRKIGRVGLERIKSGAPQEEFREDDGVPEEDVIRRHAFAVVKAKLFSHF
ncbi:hypothetical protein BJ741DRAFT_586009 [Chytriomyces cf. hyalinus JEL632]|nr:hypothetical protein BJ741DRAFT_586009 [Chytriomyces cf. hyalinus JEL632]